MNVHLKPPRVTNGKSSGGVKKSFTCDACLSAHHTMQEHAECRLCI